MGVIKVRNSGAYRGGEGGDVGERKGEGDESRCSKEGRFLSLEIC